MRWIGSFGRGGGTKGSCSSVYSCGASDVAVPRIAPDVASIAMHAAHTRNRSCRSSSSMLAGAGVCNRNRRLVDNASASADEHNCALDDDMAYCASSSRYCTVGMPAEAVVMSVPSGASRIARR